MPSVTSRTGILTDPVLTNLARQNRPEGFVADTLCPRVGVAKETGRYLIFGDRAFSATDVDLLKPDRAKTKEIDFEFTSASFSLEEYAVKASISRRERENVDSQLRLEANKLALVQDQLAMAREVRVAALLETIDHGGQLDNSMDATPSNNWDVDAGTIEADIKGAIEAINDATGIIPNTIVIPWKVANAIAMQQDIRDLFKYTVNGLQTLSAGGSILPGQIWGLNVLIPTTRKYTNAEGATDALSTVWGDEVRILYVNPSAGYGKPSVAYTFQTRGPEVRRYSEDDPEVDYILASEVLSEDIVAPYAGYILRDVLS